MKGVRDKDFLKLIAADQNLTLVSRRNYQTRLKNLVRLGKAHSIYAFIKNSRRSLAWIHDRYPQIDAVYIIAQTR